MSHVQFRALKRDRGRGAKLVQPVDTRAYPMVFAVVRCSPKQPEQVAFAGFRRNGAGNIMTVERRVHQPCSAGSSKQASHARSLAEEKHQAEAATRAAAS